MSTIPEGDLGWTMLRGGSRHAPAVVLVHGWGADATGWRDHITLLEEEFHVLAPDLPGHGLTRPDPEPADIPALTAGLAKLIEWWECGPVVVVGHSLGAQPCVRLAVEHPALVRAVAVIDPAYGADDAEMAAAPSMLADLERRGAEAGTEFVDRAFGRERGGRLWQRARARMLATDGRVLARLFHSMYLAEDAIGGRDAAEEMLARLRVPLLSLHSSAPAECWAWSLAMLPGSKVVYWPDSSHYLHQERPAEFCALLRSWLADV
jgi:pimeloyl-ACP methyl ester carboxylesterase